MRHVLRPIPLMTAAAMAACVSVVVLLPPAPASAYAGKVTCKQMVSQADTTSTGLGSTILASCSRPSATGGYGTFTSTFSFGPSTYTITWASGGTTTFTTTGIASGPGNCLAGLRAGVYTGSVIADTDPASAIALGAHVSFGTCLDYMSKATYLVSGTTAKF
jgi:hypothetical protein